MTRLDVEAARALLARVEQASASSHELDFDIGFLIGGWSTSPVYRGMLIDSAGNSFPDSPGASYDQCFTESLNAATALIARVLPEAAWGVSVEPPTPAGGVKYHAFVGDHFPSLDAIPGKWWGEADYRDGAAQALCIALLKALISKAEGERS